MVELTGDQRIQNEVLEGLATAVNHRHWFVELAVPYLGADPLEVGSGLGDYAVEWARWTPQLTATEADPQRLVTLKERLAGYPSIEVEELLLPADRTGEHSAVVAYNVLEHILDDVAAVRSMAELTREGGNVILIVPAFQFAMSRVDVATGHVRRYTTRSMAEVLHAAGLTIRRLQYVNALGLMGYYVATSLLKLTPKEGAMVWCYDRFVLPLTRAVESLHRPPFGQSVFAVAAHTTHGRRR